MIDVDFVSSGGVYPGLRCRSYRGIGPVGAIVRYLHFNRKSESSASDFYGETDAFLAANRKRREALNVVVGRLAFFDERGCFHFPPFWQSDMALTDATILGLDPE